MCELRRDTDPIVAQGQHGTLFVQCLRLVPQNERHESTSNQTAPKIGKCLKQQLQLQQIIKVLLTVCQKKTKFALRVEQTRQYLIFCQQWVNIEPYS